MGSRSRGGRPGGRGDGPAWAAVRGLYYVTSDWPELGRTHEGVAILALAGGSRLVQFRDKSSRGGRRLEAARAVREACRAGGALFIVNDDPALAIELEADGLHLGQRDLGRLDEWRRFTGRPKEGRRRARLLGVSAAGVEEAVRAVELGADYVGAGPIFPTQSKPDAVTPIGLEGLRAIRRAVDVPLAAIGGVCASNAAEVLAAGADALCVMSAVALARDPLEAARLLSDVCAAAGATPGRSTLPTKDEIAEVCDE